MAAASDRQLEACALLALVSGASSAISRARFGLFSAAQSGNIVRLAVEAADSEWEWAGVYATVIALYVVGTLLGLLYLQTPQRARRAASAFVLACLFVALDALLNEGMPDASPVARSLVASITAAPLGAQNIITTRRVGIPASSMTSNLQGTVGTLVDRAQAWARGRSSERAAMTHEEWLRMAMPVIFALGAVAGAYIERAVSYAFSLLAPLFALGLYVSEAQPRPPAPPAGAMAPLVPLVPPPLRRTGAPVRAAPAAPAAARTTNRVRFVLHI